jgi:hypothetical protein
VPLPFGSNPDVRGSNAYGGKPDESLMAASWGWIVDHETAPLAYS